MSIVIKNNKAFVTYVEGITILPTVMKFEGDDAEKLENSETLSDLCDAGVLEIIETEETTVVTIIDAVTGSKVTDAIDLIKKSVDVEGLTQLLKLDDRKGVQTAVTEQLEIIENRGKTIETDGEEA